MLSGGHGTSSFMLRAAAEGEESGDYAPSLPYISIELCPKKILLMMDNLRSA